MTLPWAAYIRVSTRDQGLKFSPIKQLTAIAAWARANRVHIPGIETAAAGNTVRPSEFILFDQQSGKNDHRPDFQRGMELARTRRIGGMVAFCVDRTARNVVDAISLRKTLKKMGVRLDFATQTFDDSPSGALMYTVFSAFAEFEGQIILGRTGDGRLRRVQGNDQKRPKLHSGGSVLYGYKYQDGSPVIDEAEAKVATIILSMADQRKTGYQIFQHLNREGYRTRKGMLWRREGVSQLLSKAVRYAGTYTHHHGIEAAKREHAERLAVMGENAPPLDLSTVTTIEAEIYPPLIDKETARRIAANLTRNKQAKAGRPSRRYLLTGLIWCAGTVEHDHSVCRHRWTSSPGNKATKPCYRCTHVNSQSTFRKLCGARQVSCVRLETTVIDAMRRYLRQPEVAHAMALQEHEAVHGTAAKQRRSDVEKRLAALRHEQAHLDEQALRADLPKRTRDLAEKRLKELEVEEMDLKAELRQQSVTVLPSRSAIVTAFGELLAELDHLETFEDRREFLESTVSRIETDGETVTITGTITTQSAGAHGHQKNCNCGLGGDAEGQKKNSLFCCQNSAVRAGRRRACPWPWELTLLHTKHRLASCAVEKCARTRRVCSVTGISQDFWFAGMVSRRRPGCLPLTPGGPLSGS
jgi:DNA invertase Pin-like site-specific DNA recombinase